MDKVVVEKEVAVGVPVENSATVASSAIWAVAFIIMLGLIVGALYYSGALRRLSNPVQPQKINVEVQQPPAPAAAPANH